MELNTYDSIRASVFSELFDSPVKGFSVSLKIPGFSPKRLSEIQTRLDRVDGEKVLWLVVLSVYQSAKTDRPVNRVKKCLYPRPARGHVPTSYHDHGSLFDLFFRHFFKSIMRREITCRKDVCHENKRIICNLWWGFHHSGIG